MHEEVYYDQELFEALRKMLTLHSERGEKQQYRRLARLYIAMTWSNVKMSLAHRKLRKAVERKFKLDERLRKYHADVMVDTLMGELDDLADTLKEH